MSIAVENNYNSVVEVRDIALAYSRVAVIEIEYLAIRPGETISVVGPSGSGKTTLLRALNQELKLDRGTIEFASLGPSNEASKLNSSRTIQSFPLLHWLTVRENLELSARMKRVSAYDYDRALSTFSALHLASRYPDTLSGGEKCRASLSQALVGDPRLLLLDEPFTGLDIATKEAIAANIFSWSEQTQAGVVFVTHELHDAIRYSSRAVVISSGKPGGIVASIDTTSPDAYQELRLAMMAQP